MRNLKVGDIVSTNYDVADTTGSKTFSSGTLFKVSEIRMINTFDTVGEVVCLRPLFSERGTEVDPVDIRDITTCNELIEVNTERAQRILKEKNYERKGKICTGFIIAVLIIFALAILSSVLSEFFPAVEQFMSSPVSGPVFVVFGVVFCVSFFGFLPLIASHGMVNENAIKCVLAMRALRVNNPKVSFTPLNLSSSGVNMSSDEIEQQAIEALLRAKNIQKNIAKGKREIDLSQFRLGEKGNEYAVYKAVAKNTLDNLKVLQDFLQSQTTGAAL